MDEISKLQLQLSELAKAQSALMNQRPPDVDGFQQISSRVSTLQFRLLALAGAPQIAPVDPQTVSTLQAAVRALGLAVTASAGATQILQAATALANA